MQKLNMQNFNALYNANVQRAIVAAAEEFCADEDYEDAANAACLQVLQQHNIIANVQCNAFAKVRSDFDSVA